MPQTGYRGIGYKGIGPLSPELKGEVMRIRAYAIAALGVMALVAGPVSGWAEHAPGHKAPAVVSAPAAAQADAPAAAAALDKRALDALKLMSDTISQAKTVQFQARSMVPVRTPDGIWINLYGASQVVLQGPDKLFASTAGDFAPYNFYFDGKSVTAYSPAKNLYAVKPAPATIDEMVEEAYRKEGKSFPYANILVSEPYALLTKGLTSAQYVGQSTLKPLSGQAGVKTDHFVFSNAGVQWQLWLDTSDHLPRLVCATYLDDASEPSYTVEFGGWKLNEPVSPDAFIFKNESNAAKVEFRNPMQAGRMPAASK